MIKMTSKELRRIVQLGFLIALNSGFNVSAEPQQVILSNQVPVQSNVTGSTPAIPTAVPTPIAQQPVAPSPQGANPVPASNTVVEPTANQLPNSTAPTSGAQINPSAPTAPMTSPSGSGISLPPQAPPSTVNPSANTNSNPNSGAAQPGNVPEPPSQHLPNAGQSVLPSTIYSSSLVIRQAVSRGKNFDVYLGIKSESGNATKVSNKDQITINIGQNRAAVESVILPIDDTQPNDGMGLVFMLDVSKSLTPTQLASIKNAFKDWVASLGDRDRVALVVFGDEVKVVQDFTANKAEMINSLGSLEAKDGHTRLNDAILRAVDLARRQDDALPLRRAIVIVTDGIDESYGGASERDVTSAIESESVPIFSIGLKSGKSNHANDAGLRLLGTYARASGGELKLTNAVDAADAVLQFERILRSDHKVTGACSECVLDGRLYPVNLTLRESGRVLTATGKIRMIAQSSDEQPQATPAASPVVEQTPAQNQNEPEAPGVLGEISRWLPDWLRPYTSYLLVGLLVLLLLLIILLRVFKKPEAVLDTPEIGSGVQGVAWDFSDNQFSENPRQFDEVQSQTVQRTVIDSYHRTKPGLQLKITLIDGHKGGFTKALSLDEVLIAGRATNADIQLPDDLEISNKHFRLVRRENDVFIQDLGSTNGTSVNGVGISSSYKLDNGDVIGVGRSSYRITW